jgi:DNA ligase-1
VLDPKTGLRKKKIKPVATGLWSRYGNPIIAPDWFLNQLPVCPLDGELWAGRGNFQLCRSICAGDDPDPRFDQISFAVYSSPSLANVLQPGTINDANMVATFERFQMESWVDRRTAEIEGYAQLPARATFADELVFMQNALDNCDPDSRCYMHQQTLLSTDKKVAAGQLDTYLDRILNEGGEGIILRDPAAVWTPKRVGSLLKFKPFLDSEATVVGFTSGDVTAKGSRLLGMIGALIVDWHGKQFKLAGLNDAERTFANGGMVEYAKKHPDQVMPANFYGTVFKVGDLITFRYRELTDEGLPKEARYWRQGE